jgi:ketopantoate reductase
MTAVAERPPRKEIPVPTFKSIGIVGANGQTGRLYLETVSKSFPDMHITAISRSGYRGTITFSENVSLANNVINVLRQQENRPQALILATTNHSADELLDIIAKNVGDRPLTLILPQNGIEVSEKALKILTGKNVTLIRASLFSPVSTQENGSIKYNPEKLRIGLALMLGEGVAFDKDKDATLQKTAAMFKESGFDVKTFNADYENLEWTKLVLNAMASTGGVTGYTPEQTLNDSELYALEMKATADRLKILQAAGIDYLRFDWGGANLLPLTSKPSVRKIFKPLIKHFIIKGRENKPSGAWLNIMAGKLTELIYYHQPFIDKAKEYGLRSFVDEAILEVAKMHREGAIDLRKWKPVKRKEFLLATYHDLIWQAGKAA